MACTCWVTFYGVVWKHDHSHPAGAGFHGFDHVQDEGVVALGARRHAPAEAAELVDIGPFKAPLLQAERRVAHHDVEVLEAGGTVEQLGVADHVQLADKAGAQVQFGLVKVFQEVA